MAIIIPTSWNYLQSQAVKSNTIAMPMIEEPTTFRASENVIPFFFSPYDQNPLQDGKARITINVTSTIPAGEKFIISNNTLYVSLTASTAPTYNEFWTTVSTPTIAIRTQIAESVAYELINNTTFNQYYNVWSVGTQIFIEAKVSGVNLNLVPTLPTGMTVQPGSLIFGINKYKPENYIDYSLFIEVYVADGAYGDIIDRTTATKVDTLLIPYNSAEQQAVNINGILKDYVDVVLPKKRNNVGLTIKELDDSSLPVTRPYFIVYGDAYRYVANGDKKYMVQGMSSIRYVQNAALDYLTPYNLEDYMLNTSSSNTFKFLTSCPNNKEVTYMTHEYLSWYMKSNGTGGEWGVEVVWRFNDGTTQTDLMVGGPTALIKGTVTLDVSPGVLNILGAEYTNNKQVDSYTVRVYYTNGVSLQRFYSEARHYKYHRKCNEYAKNFIFCNEFGVFDSIEFRGDSSEQLERDFSTVDRNLPFNANTLLAVPTEVSLVNNVDITTRHKANTVLLASHYQWIKRMMSSTAIFLYNDAFKNYQHVIINSSDFNFNTIETEFNLEIDYNYTTPTNTISR